MLVDFLAEGFAFLGVSEGKLEGAGGDAERLGGDADAAASQGLHGEFEAETILSEAVGLGHLDVLEHQGVRVAAADAHLVFLGADDEAVHAALHDEAVDAAVALVGVGLGHDQVDARRPAVGDPVLGAVEEVMVPHVDGRRALAGGVASRLGLTQAEGPDLLSPGEGGEELLLLLLRSVGLQSPTHQAVVDRDADGGGSINLRQLLHGEDVADRVHATSAIFGVDHHAHEAQFTELAHLVGGKTLFVVPVDDAGFEDVLGEIAGGIAHGALLFVEFQDHCRSLVR